MHKYIIFEGRGVRAEVLPQCVRQRHANTCSQPQKHHIYETIYDLICQHHFFPQCKLLYSVDTLSWWNVSQGISVLSARPGASPYRKLSLCNTRWYTPIGWQPAYHVKFGTSQSEAKRHYLMHHRLLSLKTCFTQRHTCQYSPPNSFVISIFSHGQKYLLRSKVREVKLALM